MYAIRNKIQYTMFILLSLFIPWEINANENGSSTLLLPQVLESKYIFDGFIKLRNDRLRYSDGYEQNYYYLVTRSSAVVIVAVTPEGQLVMNKEYRHATGSVLLSLPGGCIDPGKASLMLPSESYKKKQASQPTFMYY